MNRGLTQHGYTTNLVDIHYSEPGSIVYEMELCDVSFYMRETIGEER